VYTVDDWNNIQKNDHVLLMNDLDFKDYNYIPLTLFSGTLDGQGYRLSNISMTLTDEFVGLFEQISNADIRNLVLENIRIEATHPQAIAGSLAGRIESTTMDGIRVINTKIISPFSAAGLAGHVINSQLSKIQVQGTITGTLAVGGLIAKIEPLDPFAESIELNVVSIDKASFIGSITGDMQVGGLVGSISMSTNIHITESFSKGTLNAIENAGFMVGEILSSSLNVSNSYSSMTIQYPYDESFQGNFGLIGSRIGDGSSNNPLIIQNVYQNTSMMGTGTFVNQKAWVGFDIDGVEPKLSNAYYNQDTLQILDVGAQNTESLRNKNTYIDHDFDTIWWIDPSINDAYPILQWETFRVEFHPNNLTEVLSQRFIKDSLIITPEVSYEGYTFEAWYTDEALTQRFDETTIVSNDLTLYAKWTEIISDDEEVFVEKPIEEEQMSGSVNLEPANDESTSDQVINNEAVQVDKISNSTQPINNENNNQAEDDEEEIIIDTPKEQEIIPEPSTVVTPIKAKKSCWWWLWLVLALLAYLVYRSRKSRDMVQ
jgi:uncharacterized repeat protein (TIGR02543 family)